MPFKFLTITAFLSFIFIILQMAFQTATGKVFSEIVGLIPFGDKTMHFIIMVFFAVLLNGWCKLRRVKFVGQTYLLGSFLVACLITFEECTQLFIPARHFEIMDLVCNYAGIYAGSVLSWMVLPTTQDQTTIDLNEWFANISLSTIFPRSR